MDDNELRQWLIDCFGPVEGEAAWQQINNLPEQIKEQMLAQSPDQLPKPEDVKAMMQAFAAGGLQTTQDAAQAVEAGPINVKLAKSIALQEARKADTTSMVDAQTGTQVRQAMSEANLWLDTTCNIDPVDATSGSPEALTPQAWVEQAIDAWAKFAGPVASSMNDALVNLLQERLGDIDGEIQGISMFAGPVPISMPEGLNKPADMIRLIGNTSFAMQLGRAAGALSHEVRGSFDQGIALLKNPAGGLIVSNIKKYAEELSIPEQEVMEFIALREVAHARLFAHVGWLMPRFESLITKYARGIDIDTEAMEEQLREATSLDPDALSGAMNVTNVSIPDSPEQKEALASLERLLALVEGWVDCVTWRAAIAHLPHVEQLREMARRQRAVGGPAERTFESLLGLQMHPKQLREAAAAWEQIGNEQGIEARDALWSHPDLLPTFADNEEVASHSQEPATNSNTSSVDWDAELSKLLSSDLGDLNESDKSDESDESGNPTDSNHNTGNNTENTEGDGNSGNSGDKSNG